LVVEEGATTIDVSVALFVNGKTNILTVIVLQDSYIVLPSLPFSPQAHRIILNSLSSLILKWNVELVAVRVK